MLILNQSEVMISDELQIDNYEEHICPRDMTSDEDNQATQEELLQQEGLKKMLRYDAK